MTTATGDERGVHPTANELERRRWNDAYWTSVWPKREAFTDNVTADLLAHLDATKGERILEIGSGGGRVTLTMAELVGPEGLVVGADISEPLLRLAGRKGAAGPGGQRRLRPGGRSGGLHSGSSFHRCHEPVRGDVLRRTGGCVRQHPTAGEQTGGRLVFVCWQSMDRNPWALGHTIGAYTPVPIPAPGKSPTGPFTLGDFEQTSGILVSAGWQEPQATPYERIVTVDRSAIFDDGQLAFNGVAEENLPAAHDAIERHLAQFAPGRRSSRRPGVLLRRDRPLGPSTIRPVTGRGRNSVA